MRAAIVSLAVLATAGLLASEAAAATVADRSTWGPSVQLVSHGCYGGYYSYPSYHGYYFYRGYRPVYPHVHAVRPYPYYYRQPYRYRVVPPRVYYRGPHVGVTFW